MGQNDTSQHAGPRSGGPGPNFSSDAVFHLIFCFHLTSDKVSHLEEWVQFTYRTKKRGRKKVNKVHSSFTRVIWESSALSSEAVSQILFLANLWKETQTWNIPETHCLAAGQWLVSPAKQACLLAVPRNGTELPNEKTVIYRGHYWDNSCLNNSINYIL